MIHVSNKKYLLCFEENCSLSFRPPRWVTSVVLSWSTLQANRLFPRPNPATETKLTRFLPTAETASQTSGLPTLHYAPCFPVNDYFSTAYNRSMRFPINFSIIFVKEKKINLLVCKLSVIAIHEFHETVLLWETGYYVVNHFTRFEFSIFLKNWLQFFICYFWMKTSDEECVMWISR